jgi:hypothetical protein
VGKRRGVRLAALATLVVVLVACNGLTVDQRGVYTNSPTQQITGTVTVAQGDSLQSVTVNGVPATVDGNTYRVDLPLDGEKIFNEVLVEASFARGDHLRERRTVVYGDGEHATIVPAGQALDDAVGLRVNERSFSKLEPVVRNLTTIDTAAIAPVGSVLLDQCISQVVVCTIYAKATTSGPATLDDFSVALDSNQDNVNALVTLTGVHVPVDVHAIVFGIPTDCDMVVDADAVHINGNYALQPDAADPRYLDVNLVGATPTVTTEGVTSDFVGGVCSIPLIEQIVDLFLPDVDEMLRTRLTMLLGDPDGTGPADSPVADAIEQALAKLNIAGPIGDSLGLTLDSTIASADEDPNGIGLRATARFTSSGVAPEAPDLSGSVGFGDVLGALPDTTPGGQPFDVAVGASASSFNQLLAGETERGLLNVDINSLDGQPLTLRSLLDTIGAGGLITEDHPVVISLRPEVAPIVTTGSGPDGALGSLVFHGYRVTVRATDGQGSALMLELVLDFTTGVGLVVRDDGLAFTFDQPAPENFSSDIVQNPLGLPTDVVDAIFQQLSPQVFASVQDVLPSFPLPQFAGLDLSLVDVDRVGTGFVLFADLVAGG